MATTSFSAISAVISGGATSINFGLASDDTCIISAPGSDTLDLSRLIIRVSNNISAIGSAGSGVRVYITAGSSYSSVGLGTYRVDVASNGTAVIGGKEFEAARFLSASAQSIVLRIGSSSSATTAMCTVEAYQLPTGFTA
jgi:hypothetical protein